MRKKFTLALLSLLMVPLAMMAQTVTVSPTTGNLVAAATGGNEVGFQNGWSSVWKHEQLPLSFTVSDYDNLSAGGDVMVPAGNINVRNGQLVVMGGVSMDLYCVLSLPKGYRFKSYKLVLLNNLNGVTVSGMRIGYATTNATGGTYYNVSKVMYETDSSYGKSGNEDDNSVVSYNVKSETMGGARTDNSDTREYVITRTSRTNDDMGNMLYFRLNRSTNAFFGVTIKSFEVEFTAEGAFDAKVAPDEVGHAVSLVTAPFTTSKTDVGQLQQHETTSGATYYSYDYINTKDMEAYTYLYQQDAVADGVPSDVAEVKNITPVKVDGQFLYALGNDTYYIETPTHVKSQTGWNAPVGYRITGARFDYLWGTETPAGNKIIDACYITCTYNNRTYYLNGDLHFTTTRFAWTLDDDGNICNGNRYLACWGSSDQRYLTYSTDATSRYNLKRNNTGVYYISSSNTYYYLQYRYRANNYSSWNYVLQEPLVIKTGTNYSNTNGYAGSSTEEGASIPYDGFSPGAYTLKIYDKTGTAAKETITVNSASDAGSTYLGGLNNDAVKFSIEGLASGKQALVSVTLTLETLNPYINKMDIVAEDETKELHLTQTFTANDFSVTGGAFKFYIPEDYAGEDITFSFRDLYSNDGDETYFDDKGKPGTGHARYSFVSSPYFETVDGNGDNGLYDSAYDPDLASTTKIYATNVGNIRFKFNNAENLSNTGGQTGTTTLEEYDFSVSKYLGSEDPDGSTETGAFNQIVLNSGSPSTTSDVAFLFTADETRYNIAPTTAPAWQHRTYAFYRMDITLEAKSYTPDLTWTKLYGNTCYVDTDENNKEVDANKEMWGVTLGTLDENGKKVEGHLSAEEIELAITAAIESAGTNHPTSLDQILYVDGSDLTTVVSSHTFSVESINETLAPNSLFFLPKNMTSTADNIAYKTSSGSFNAAKNIVLVDRKPFFSPYDIQIGAAPNYAMYTRNVTWQKNGKATNASLIVPFQIAVDDEGKHDDGEGNVFYVYQIQSDGDCLSENPQADDDFLHMLPLEGMKVTEPNVPYVVSVKEAPDDANVSFVVKQPGALLKATTEMDDNYEFAGATGTGTDEKASVTFSMKGSYSGQKISKADRDVFYFAKNMFFDIKSLSSWITDLYVYPFRAYFDYEAAGAKTFNSLDIFFGENFEVDGIEAVESEPIAVDANAPVYDVQGRMISTSVRELAGKKLARGIYVVNGVKFTVK